MTAAAVPPTDAGRIRRLAHQFWSAAGGPPDVPRDPEPHIARAVHRYQMHVIDLPKLTCATVAAWAQRNHFPTIDAATDRPLRGCLFTYAGSAFLLVDPSDPPDQRRVTIAHELGHFLIEVSEPRRRVRHALGADALDVLDGHRPPTFDERIHAVLAGAPLAAHVHLMAREEDGSIGCPRVADAECAADRFALELLAPAAALRPHVLPLASLPREQRWSMIADRLIHRHGLPPIVAGGYARELVQDLTGGESVREWLGLST